jgi:polysaccharide pyruvyl transferase WcaK-like protein
MCALKLAKPTLSISYAAKHDVLMADMGLSEFCLPAISLDGEVLAQRFRELESRAAQLRQTITEGNLAKKERLNQQFAALSALLFPPADKPSTAGNRPWRPRVSKVS